MSAALVVVDGDMLQFMPMFGNRTVTPTGPARIMGTGHAAINKKRVCILGDEKKVQVPATYMTASHPTPGQGMITIAALAGDQQTPPVRSLAALIVKGSRFTARFTPTVPASHPVSGPEPTAPTMGQGSFIVTQFFVNAKK